MRTALFWTVSGCLLAALCAAMPSEAPEPDFRVPDAGKRREAVGPTGSLPVPLQRALDPGDDFEPVPVPGPGDWLAVHEEEGQTFKEFRKLPRNIPTGKRKVLYLQPLGELTGELWPATKILEEFAEAFFGLEVKVLEARALGKDEFSPRVNGFTGRRQICAADVLKSLKKSLPDDAFCLLAITLEDLYPDPSWNFVFGAASLRGRTGVYSFARYDPAFHGAKREKGAGKLILRRSLKVLAHETGHMFGIHHCIHYLCLMNGSNHLEEADSAPLFLCPVCLRKLHDSVRFDVVRRYRKLQALYAKTGLEDEARWVERRLKHIEAE